MKHKCAGPLLSVVIPVYNVEGYLDRCIKSIENQSYRNIEIILVDDGSTDKSGEMCDQYALEDNRIKVIHKENGGLVSARKAGLRIAVGEYVAYVDSDDWIEKDMYNDMVSLIKESQADIVTSGSIRDYTTYCVIQNELLTPGVYENRTLVEDYLKQMISMEEFFQINISFNCWNKIYKRGLLVQCQNKVDDFVNVGEDAALIYLCLLNADKVVVSGKNYYHYCMRRDSILGNKKSDELQRLQILFRSLSEEGVQHRNRVANIMEQIELHKLYMALLGCADKVVQYSDGILFPYGEVHEKDKIVIYGAGRFGYKLKRILEKKYHFKIQAWIDKSEKYGTQTIESLDNIKYDKIIIAVLLADMVNEIKKEKKDTGIKQDKTLFLNLNMLKSVKLDISDT